MGGALEAALCGVRGIAVSFGSKEAQGEEVIAAAARLGTRVVEALSRTWDGRVEVYNLNIPMRGDVESRPVVYTRSVGSYWRRGCLYTETQTGDQTGTGDQGEGKERRFVWNADLTDMKRDLLAAGEGTDAFTVLNGCTR